MKTSDKATYWRLKKLYIFFVLSHIKTKIKKFFQSFTLPAFAIGQIRRDQVTAPIVRDQTQIDLEWKRLFARCTPKERIEAQELMLAVFLERYNKPVKQTQEQ